MGFCFGLCHGLCTVSVRSLYRDQIAQSGDDGHWKKYRFSQRSLLRWSLCGLRAAMGSPLPSPSPFAPRQSPARPRRGQRRKAVAPKGRTAFFTRGGLGPGLGRRPRNLLLVRFLIAFLRRQRLCVEKRTQNIEFHKLAVTSATTCWRSQLRIGSWRRQCNQVFCLQCNYAQGMHW